MFIGFAPLDGNLPLKVLLKNGDTPENTDSLPTYRVYGPAGLMNSGSGSLALGDSGSITGASNASPIEITSSNHGLSTGTTVTITGVLGNTAANGTWTITKTSANKFTLDSSVGNGTYTSAGTWNVTGLYGATLSVAAAQGYEAGEIYQVLVSGDYSSVPAGELFTFGVV